MKSRLVPTAPALRKGVVTVLILFLTLALSGCPPKQPCDQKIEDPSVYEEIVLADPVIQQLEQNLKRLRVTISDCINNDQVWVVIEYELPAEYSDFGVKYRDWLSLVYSLNGTIDISTTPLQAVSYDVGSILDTFQARIAEVETNPRAREVLAKTDPDPDNPTVPLFGDRQVLREGNWVEYNFFYHRVRGYLLSNDIGWEEFPEIKQAHQIIEAQLLVGELKGCTIGHGKMHAYTAAEFHDADTDPWNLTVALQCPDGWRDASIRIHPDGSYDNLQIITKY
jgi:hypothetical protein